MDHPTTMIPSVTCGVCARSIYLGSAHHCDAQHRVELPDYDFVDYVRASDAMAAARSTVTKYDAQRDYALARQGADVRTLVENLGYHHRVEVWVTCEFTTTHRVSEVRDVPSSPPATGPDPKVREALEYMCKVARIEGVVEEYLRAHASPSPFLDVKPIDNAEFGPVAISPLAPPLPAPPVVTVPPPARCEDCNLAVANCSCFDEDDASSERNDEPCTCDYCLSRAKPHDEPDEPDTCDDCGEDLTPGGICLDCDEDPEDDEDEDLDDDDLDDEDDEDPAADDCDCTCQTCHDEGCDECGQVDEDEDDFADEDDEECDEDCEGDCPVCS